MGKLGEDKKVSVNALISIRQYMALSELVEQGVFESISEAIREGVEKVLEEQKGVLKEVGKRND